jgi:preprotein translocase subunit SecE
VIFFELPGGGAGKAAPNAGQERQMAKNPFQFLQAVRSEGAKVTWPSRRETLITTGLVLAMVVVASIFFFFTDSIIRWSLGLILGAR